MRALSVNAWKICRRKSGTRWSKRCATRPLHRVDTRDGKRYRDCKTSVVEVPGLGIYCLHRNAPL
jgi:hypothetical protein